MAPGLDDLTVLVVGSPIRSHPSTEIIDATVKSLGDFLGLTPGDLRASWVFAHDGPRWLSGCKRRRSFEAYLSALRNRYGAGVELVVRRGRGGLTKNLLNGLQHVKTPWVLIVQHDLPFIAPVDVGAVLDLMRQDERVQHLRFNRHTNGNEGAWDSTVPPAIQMEARVRADFYRGVTATSGHQLMQTLSWSDNNHVCAPSYYENLVAPMVGFRGIPPERAMMPLVTPSTHVVFGTYLWGGQGDGPFIRHSDGRASSTSTFGKLLRRFSFLGESVSAIRFALWRLSFAYSRVRFKRFGIASRGLPRGRETHF
jgi:hypothetical protein